MPDLVFLEMANEVPAQVRWQQRNFCTCLLHPTFTEQILSGFNRLAHFLGRVCLRNRDELDVFHGPTSFHGRLRDPLAHVLEIVGYRTHLGASTAADAYYFSNSVLETSTATTPRPSVLARIKKDRNRKVARLCNRMHDTRKDAH